MVTRWVFVAAVLSVAVAGCSRPTATVSGQVAFQNQPVPAGSVTFIHANGTTVSGSIQEGGYSIAKVHTGPCTILVVSLPPPQPIWNPKTNEKVGAGAVSGKPQKALPIPPRYGDSKQSDLHYDVTTGSQT